MNHADLKNQLADYLEGELPLDRRARVDAHLDDCPDCAQDVEEMLQTIQLLHRLPEPEIPPMITANVMRRIRSGENQLGFFERIGTSLATVLEPRFVLPASAIAAAALVVTVVQDPSDLSKVEVVPEGDGISMSRSSSTAAARPAPVVAGLYGRPSDSFGGLAPASVTAGEDRPQFRVEIDLLAIPRQPNSPSPMLAPPVPATRVVAGRFRSAVGGARPVAGHRVLARAVNPARVQSSGGRDPRDEWLARVLEDPVDFARYITAQTLAEQELWVARLSDRAEERGLLDELVRALRDSGDPNAAWIADDFSSQRRSSQTASSQAERVSADSGDGADRRGR